MNTRIRNFLIIVAGILFLLINARYLGISFWFLDRSYQLFCMVLLILSSILLLSSIYLTKKSKLLSLLGILVSMTIGVYFSMILALAPDVYKVDSLKFGDDIKIDVYKVQNQNHYTLIQRNRFLILSRNDCIYWYEHFTGGTTWEKIDESTLLVRGDEIEISKNWFTDISCPEE